MVSKRQRDDDCRERRRHRDARVEALIRSAPPCRADEVQVEERAERTGTWIGIEPEQHLLTDIPRPMCGNGPRDAAVADRNQAEQHSAEH